MASKTIVSLGGLIAGLLALGVSGIGCGGGATATASDGITPPNAQITILTPHSQSIRNAFSFGFSRWYQAKHGKPAVIRWISLGTPQCLRYVEDAFRGQSDIAPPVPDVMFGGGIADHRWLKQKGYSRKVNLGDMLAGIPTHVAGLPTRDDEGFWYGTGLSSFGVLCNTWACAQRDIAPPQTWSDLADPRFAGWVGLADPSASGSTRECLMVILQAQGWDAGWSTAVRILANARSLAPSSGDALNGVRNGIFLASFCVNFDGLRLAAESGGRLTYVNPPGATALTPDVLSVLNSTGDDKVALAFAEFVLSEEGQLLWGGKAGRNAAASESLYHYPIRPDIYTKHGEELAMAENPFEMDFGVQLDQNRYERHVSVVLPLFAALADSNHILLQRAWSAVCATGLPEAVVIELTAAPLPEDAAILAGESFNTPDSSARSDFISDWTRRFTERFRRVLAESMRES